MEALDSKKFRTRAKGELFGGYLFYGEEEYLKRNALAEARKSVFPDGPDSFNHIRLDADNYSVEALENAIMALPVFAEKKLIEIHSLALSAMKDKEIEGLCAILSLLEDSNDTVLILYTVPAELDPGDIKKPSKQFKALSEVLNTVHFEKQSRDMLAKWVSRHFAHNKIVCNLDMSYALMDRCGSDMFNLVTETDKLSAYVLSKGRDTLTIEDIELLATKTKEIGAFDFSNAILARDTDKAFYILSSYEAEDKSGKEVNLTLGSLISIFRTLCRISVLAETGMQDRDIAKALKINEYRCSLYRKALGRRSTADIERILELCAETDRLLKSGSTNGYALLSRLIIEAAR
ncbi:MAG: DNA polymerase III subunit delta [Clostridia bacterium]|nr:DNA polymerase III subunit delta [Clostridia bacterium]